jgi:phospholipase C
MAIDKLVDESKPDIAAVNADPLTKQPVLVKQDKVRCEILPVSYDFQVFVKYGTHTEGKTRVEWQSEIPALLAYHSMSSHIRGLTAPGSIALKAIEVSDYAQIIGGSTAGDHAHVIHGPQWL